MLKNKKLQKRYLGPEGDPPAGGAPPAGGTPPKLHTDEEVNNIVKKRLADEKKKFDVERAENLSRIAKLEPDSQKLAELQVQIEELERKGKSAAELVEMDRKKEREKLESQAKQATADAEKWRRKLEDTQLDRDLLDAASTQEADFVNAQQGVLLLKQGAKIGPKHVDGKPTDVLETRVKIQTIKDGKTIELDLSPVDAIKVLKEDKTNYNYFNAGIKGGLGGTQSNNSRSGAGGKLGLSQEEFSKRYAKGTLPKD